ncbi:MAG: hypothetical protein GY906_21305, partial [bacterium]|nr:hypothetical protein [bacterium]
VDIGPYSATIAWTTDEPATTQLEYGPSSALGRFSLRDPTLMLNHEMLLDGLDPATTYYFRAHSQDYAGNESASSTHALSSLAIVGPVYHVDQNHPLANDTNDGSEAAPWLTIQHAADVASPGDTVIVHPGSYGRVRFNHGGAPGNHITFRGSSTPDQSLVEQDAIYDPYNPVQIPGNPTLNAVCRGFHLQPPYGVVDPIIFVRIEGFEITAIYDPEGDPVQGGVLLSNTEHIQVVSNFLHDLNPSQYGYIGIRGSTHDNVDIIVRNNTIYRVQGTGISLVGKRWLVEDNEV